MVACSRVFVHNRLVNAMGICQRAVQLDFKYKGKHRLVAIVCNLCSRLKADTSSVNAERHI